MGGGLNFFHEVSIVVLITKNMTNFIHLQLN